VWNRLSWPSECSEYGCLVKSMHAWAGSSRDKWVVTRTVCLSVVKWGLGGGEGVAKCERAEVAKNGQVAKFTCIMWMGVAGCNCVWPCVDRSDQMWMSVDTCGLEWPDVDGCVVTCGWVLSASTPS
jgi:hypothetical protein